MDRTKWNIAKLKGRWWLIKPLDHKTPWIAAHVGTFQECVKHANP
jgi:hypothetical protein